MLGRDQKVGKRWAVEVVKKRKIPTNAMISVFSSTEHVRIFIKGSTKDLSRSKSKYSVILCIRWVSDLI
jgi:hypothetical protein